MSVALAASVVTVLALPGAAQAGRLVATGHDPDHHCGRAEQRHPQKQCRFVSVGVDYVRAGAPDKTKPVLILDRGALDFVNAIRNAYPADAAVPFEVVDPRSDAFASLSLTTDKYSAILVASSKDAAFDASAQDLNEFNSTPDTDAINARAGDIAKFFNAGGGIFVSSGGKAARENSARYYRFLSLTRAGAAVTTPFSLTSLGRQIGWQDGTVAGTRDDINCCPTHLSFDLPAPESALKVAETDGAGRAVTLVADTNKLENIEEPVADVSDVFAGVPGGSTGETTGGTNGSGGSGGSGATPGTPTTRPGSPTAKPVCVRKRSLRIVLNRPRGVRFVNMTVYVNGRKSRSISGKRLGTGRRTRPIRVALPRGKRVYRVRIVVRTAAGRKLTLRQTYRPCR